MKFYIKTYGCQMNERDADAVAALLAQYGHQAVPSEHEAELLLVNTCSVRAKAEHKALGKLGLVTAPNRTESFRLVGALGCMVERLGLGLFDKVPHLSLAVGPGRLAELPGILERAQGGESRILAVGGNPNDGNALAAHAAIGVSAFVNILYGCNRGCAYCIVPAVRGPERSRPARDILAELAALAARGVREVTLLGQSVMNYGKGATVWADSENSPGGYDEPFVRLLEAAAGVPGLQRLRFTSGHPSGCTDALARLMHATPALCPHLHLPLQSGSDRILKLMRRGYTTEDYRRGVERLRQAVPGLALTTDIIVGFPTETEAEFNATHQFMAEIGFDNAFIFKYSPRPDTPAAAWPDDVPDEEKIRRNAVLLEDQNRRTAAIHQALVGQTLDVLVEGISPRNPSRLAGRTGSNKIVVFDAVSGIKAGDRVAVTIKRAMAQSLYGEIGVLERMPQQRARVGVDLR